MPAAAVLQLTLRLPLRVGVAEAALLEAVGQRYTASYNRVAEIAWTQRVSSQAALHRATYYPEKERSGLPSQLVLSARMRALESVKSARARIQKGQKASCPASRWASVRWNNRPRVEEPCVGVPWNRSCSESPLTSRTAGEMRCEPSQSERLMPGEPNGVEAAASAAVRADSYYRVATELREMRRLDEAMRSYVDALLTLPDHGPSLLGLGETLCELGRWGDALRVYRRATRLFPETLEARVGLSRVLQQLEGGAPEENEPPHPAREDARPAFLLPPPAPRPIGRSLRSQTGEQGRLLGLVTSPLVLFCYVFVGLRASSIVYGLAAAGLLALSSAALASLFFAGRRWLAFTSVVIGAALGTGALVLLAGLLTALAYFR